MSKRIVFALVVLVMAITTIPAIADTIEFTSSGFGSYTFAGTLGSTLTGNTTGVTVKQVLPVSGAPIGLAGGILNFSSGPATSLGTTNVFAAGGSISITGGACGAGCFVGTFTGVQLDISNSLFNAASVFGNVSPTTWALLGLPPQPTGATGSLIGTLIPTGHGAGLIGSVDFSLMRIPEPTSLALLGSGLLIAGGILRRKLSM